MKPKILAPAGDWKSFLVALKCGADVIYLGGKSFNARQYAENFSMDEIRNAVKLAHERGVEIYATVNTLVFDEELRDVTRYLEELGRVGVDAIIFQDLAVLELGKRLQGVKLIASTQTTTHNLEAVRFLEKLGVHGVILARELSLEEIRQIRSGTRLWLEVFVHGALCFSYSGACLMSSIIGGRSGNRGRCAQPCRKRYALIDSSGKMLAEGHLLSTRDLCLVNRLGELVEIGVDGLKIEGRMRKPEYVAVTVSVYKHTLKNVLGGRPHDGRAVEKLSLVFNRGFTEGYLNSNPGREMMNYDRPDNIGLEVGVVVGFRKGMLEVELLRDLRLGDGLEIMTREGKVGFILNEFYVKGRRVDSAKVGETVSIPFNGKVNVGCRVFKTRDVQVLKWVENILRNSSAENSSTGQVSDIYCSAQKERNLTGSYRDDVNLQHSNLREEAFNSPQSDSGGDVSQLMISVSVGDLFSLKHAVDCGADRIIIGGDYFKPKKVLSFEELGEGADYCREHGTEFILSTPRITRNSELSLISLSMGQIASLKPDGVLTGNYGTLNLFLEAGVVPVYVDYFLNVTNSLSLAKLKELGVKGVTLSPELNIKQISSLSKEGVFIECMAHGPLELMVSEHCVARSILCTEGRCSAPCLKMSFYLRDDKGFRFPLAFDQNCRMHILNSRDLCMVDALDRLADVGVKVARLDCRAGDIGYVKEVVKAYVSVREGEDPLHIKKKLRKLAPLTRGHFFRGVD